MNGAQKKEKSDDKSKGSASSSEKEEDGQDGSSGAGQSDENGQENESNGSSSDASQDAKNGDSKASDKTGKTDGNSASKQDKCQNSHYDGAHAHGGYGVHSVASMLLGDNVQEELRDALSDCKRDIEQMSSNINNAAIHGASAKANRMVKQDTDAPVSKEMVKGIVKNFCRGFLSINKTWS